MYNKSNNHQALQSQQLIVDALLFLMKKYPYEDITITQICQEAQVVRQTFYRNFESKLDILKLYIDKNFINCPAKNRNIEVDLYTQIKDLLIIYLYPKTF